MSSSAWDARFNAWSSPPGQTEKDKCENAVRAVRSAIAASPTLVERGVTVSPQGSYYNRTNVRAESDVDLCVLCKVPFFWELPSGGTPAQFGFVTPADYTFAHYREDIRAALIAHFGAESVRAGRKAFDIHHNTYRIAADAVPALQFRRFRLDGQPILGVAFDSEGKRIINFPDQHYANGVAKNDATARRFKAVTRILKRLRYEMVAAGVASAQNVQSFEIESMVWNVPNALFGAVTLREDLKRVLAHLYVGTENDEQACVGWLEVNAIKPLFGYGQPWSRAEVRPFLENAWAYAELGV